MTSRLNTARAQKSAAQRAAKKIRVTRPVANDADPDYLPGQIITQKLKERGLTQDDFAHAMQMIPMQATRLIKGRKRIDVDMAFRLDRFFGIDAKEWVVMQSIYDLSKLGPDFQATIKAQVPTIDQLVREKKKRPK